MTELDVPRHHPAARPAVTIPGVEPCEPRSSDGESASFSDVAEGMAQGFSAADQSMDLFKPSTMTKGVQTFGGAMSGLLSFVAGGAEAYDGVQDLQGGKTAKGAAELTKGAASVVGGTAEAYHAINESFASSGVSQEAKELFEHKAKNAGLLGHAASGVGGVIEGVTDVVEGSDKLRHGKSVDEKSGGLSTIVKGGAESLGGLAEGGMALTGTSSLALDADLALSAGAGGACSVVAPAAASFATGMTIGSKMESITKGSGLLEDERGHNENGSDRISRWGERIAEAIDPSSIGPGGKVHVGGQSTLAKIGGGAATYLATPIGAALDAAGTVAAGAHKLWDWL